MPFRLFSKTACLLPVFALLMSCDGQKKLFMPGQSSPKTARNLFRGDTILASDLWAYYVASDLMDQKKKADAALKGETFYVKGRIKTADRDWKEHRDHALLKVHQSGLDFIQCRLDREEDRETVSRLAEDTPVILSGRCAGYPYTVLLEDCRLVSVQPTNAIGFELPDGPLNFRSKPRFSGRSAR